MTDSLTRIAGPKKRPRTSRTGHDNIVDLGIDGPLEADGALSDDSFDSGSEKDMDETEDFVVSRKKKQTGKRAHKSHAPTSRLPRLPKQAGKGAANKRNSKAPTRAAAAPRRIQRAPISREELKIQDDVPLFNAIKNPDNALQTTAEDWVVAYQSEPGPALTELINFIIRCCGCNASVDETLVRDLDNVVDSAQDIQDEFKETSIPSYPIVSGSEQFKKFKKSLAEFFARLLTTASESDLLLTAPITNESSKDILDHPVIDVLKEWLSTLSSSSFRPFRHTATYIVLNIVDSLTGLLLQKRKALAITKKQRDAEKQKQRPDASRIKQLADRWQIDKEEDKALSGAIRDLIDGVFLHRCKDADYLIRVDCMTELGRWLRAHPDMFLTNAYIKYLGISLTDPAPQVRTASVKALLPLYVRSAFPEPLRHFTTVHTMRLIEMACLDGETTVRVNVVEMLTHIDRRGFLVDAQRDVVGLRIFDVEPRVCNEVALFLKSLIEDEVASVADDKIGSEPVTMEEAKKDTSAREKREKWETEIEKLRLKLLAKKLVHYQGLLNRAHDADGAGGDEGDEGAKSEMQDGGPRIVPAIRALWDFDDLDQPLSGWSDLVELLMYDHSPQQHTESDQNTASTSTSSRAGRGRKGASKAAPKADANYAGNHPPNSAYTLAPAEETVLLETLAAIVEEVAQRAEQAKPVVSAKQDEDPAKAMREDLTRFLVPKLPQLFAKYRTESRRVSELLRIIPFLGLNSFATAGQASVVVKLWDEVTTQYSRHSEPSILSRGAAAIQLLSAATKDLPTVSEVSANKVQQLQESLVNALREPLKGQEVATSALDEDTIFALDVNVQRLLELTKVVDCCEAMEDSENGQVSSGWEIVREIALRGKLAYGGEESMISGCLSVMFTHLAWKLRNLGTLGTSAGDEERATLADDILVKRTEAFEMMETYVLSGSSILTPIKSVAASRLLDLCLLFHASRQADVQAQVAYEERTSTGAEGDEERPSYVSTVPASLGVELSGKVQEACVGAMLSDIDSLISEREQAAEASQESREEGEATEETEDGEEGAIRNVKTTRKEAEGEALDTEASPVGRLDRELRVFQRVSPLVSSMRLGLVDLKLCAPIIARYRRAGGLMDALTKYLVEDVREAALLGGDGVMAIEVMLSSMKESFEVFLSQGTTESMDNFVALSKSLSSALVLRGPQLTILRSIDVGTLLELHKQGCEYVAKKWKAAERAEAKSIKARAPVFWKGLVNLLLSATPRDALRIKAAMDTALQSEEIEVPSSSKAWDAQRQYERKLVSIIARNKMPPPARPARTPRKEGQRSNAGGSRDGSVVRESTAELLRGAGDEPLSSPAPAAHHQVQSMTPESTSSSPNRAGQKRKTREDEAQEDESDLSEVE